METKDKGYIAGITLLLLLTAYGYIPDPNSTHTCFIDGTPEFDAYCDRFSSTGLTCYPNSDDRKGYVRCEGLDWRVIDKTTTTSLSTTTTTMIMQEGMVKYQTKSGAILPCFLDDDGILKPDSICMYDGRPQLRSEFD